MAAVSSKDAKRDPAVVESPFAFVCAAFLRYRAHCKFVWRVYCCTLRNARRYCPSSANPKHSEPASTYAAEQGCRYNVDTMSTANLPYLSYACAAYLVFSLSTPTVLLYPKQAWRCNAVLARTSQ